MHQDPSRPAANLALDELPDHYEALLARAAEYDWRRVDALEARLKARIRDLAGEQGLPVPPGPWPYVPLANMQGIDIEAIAVLIAGRGVLRLAEGDRAGQR